jgi:hypothetical protein
MPSPLLYALAITSIVSSLEAHQPSLNQILGMSQMCAIHTNSHLQVSFFAIFVSQFFLATTFKFLFL